MSDIGQRIEQGFRRILETLNFDGVESMEGSAYGLWPDLRIAYVNPWWFRFAGENRGEPGISLHWGLGRSVMDSVPDILEPFYHSLYASVLEECPSRVPVRHEYECSSPGVFRRYLMMLYCLGRGEGVLVVNSSVIETPHEAVGREPHDPIYAAYVDDHGFVHQCANCRRVKNMKEPNRWDWIPAWVAKPPAQTTHTLCSLCLPYYSIK